MRIVVLTLLLSTLAVHADDQSELQKQLSAVSIGLGVDYAGVGLLALGLLAGEPTIGTLGYVTHVFSPIISGNGANQAVRISNRKGGDTLVAPGWKAYGWSLAFRSGGLALMIAGIAESFSNSCIGYGGDSSCDDEDNSGSSGDGLFIVGVSSVVAGEILHLVAQTGYSRTAQQVRNLGTVSPAIITMDLRPAGKGLQALPGLAYVRKF